MIIVGRDNDIDLKICANTDSNTDTDKDTIPILIQKMIPIPMLIWYWHWHWHWHRHRHRPPVLTGLESAVWQLTIFVFYLQRLIQTSQTGGQRYSDTSPFSIPCLHNDATSSPTTGELHEEALVDFLACYGWEAWNLIAAYIGISMSMLFQNQSFMLWTIYYCIFCFLFTTIKL